jgi:2-polyprenyl-6-methoxyphenol hydroxylase-like FAD-dependent oxidoreductase
VNSLLRRFGIQPEEHGAVTCQYVSEYNTKGERIFLRDIRPFAGAYPYPWQLCHRVDLHNALKETATSTTVPGTPVIIHLSSRVKSVNCEAPSITLENGTTIEGDLIIGADGVHSSMRKFVAGEKIPEPSGASAFRFLIPTERVRADPQTSHFVERDGELRLVYGADRRLVIYPCRDNTLLNFVCMHPDEETEASSETWDQSVSKDTMLACFETFPEDVRRLLSMADAESINLWKLLDHQALGKENWTRGKVALLGDAAHPFLPHQGQGGAQAIEDGAALGALLPLGVKIEDLESRLKLYVEARYDRATLVQDFTRDAAFKTSRSKHGGKVLDPMQFTNINFDHDAFDYATRILRRETLQKAVFKRMPCSFGLTSSPRQRLSGGPHSQVTKMTSRTAYMTFKTPKSYLETLLPSSELSINAHGGWATATFSATKLGNLAWLGGRGYTHFGFYIHNVVHVKDSSDKENKGDFLPVLFENMADPIITGREELGFSKVFATLQEVQESNLDYSLKAGWEGQDFCQFELKVLSKVDTPSLAQEPPVLSYKVTPSLNEGGGVESEYVTVTELPPPEQNQQQWTAQNGAISFTSLEGEELELAFPTLANIIRGLRAIKVSEVLQCGIREQ